MRENIGEFRRIWNIDTEYIPVKGGLPDGVCLVARNFLDGTEIRLAEDELRCGVPEFLTAPDDLVVVFSAQAECGFFLSLGWSPPPNLIDLYVEFKNEVNGFWLPSYGLLGALRYYGLPLPLDEAQKVKMQNRILKGRPFTTEELAQIVDYCADDVTALETLFRHMCFPK